MVVIFQCFLRKGKKNGKRKRRKLDYEKKNQDNSKYGEEIDSIGKRWRREYMVIKMINIHIKRTRQELIIKFQTSISLKT